MEKRKKPSDHSCRNSIWSARSRVHAQVGERIDRPSLFEERALRDPVGCSPERSIRARAEPIANDRQGRVEPHRDTRFAHEPPLRDAEKQPASGRDDGSICAYFGLQRTPFGLPEPAFARLLKDALDRSPLGGFDARVGVREAQTQPLRDPSSHGCLSASHEADDKERAACLRHRVAGFHSTATPSSRSTRAAVGHAAAPTSKCSTLPEHARRSAHSR